MPEGKAQDINCKSFTLLPSQGRFPSPPTVTDIQGTLGQLELSFHTADPSLAAICSSVSGKIFPIQTIVTAFTGTPTSLS